MPNKPINPNTGLPGRRHGLSPRVGGEVQRYIDISGRTWLKSYKTTERAKPLKSRKPGKTTRIIRQSLRRR